VAFGRRFSFWGLVFPALPEYPRPMNDNLVALDLSRFTSSDLGKLSDLRKKLMGMRRWCRYERTVQDGRDSYLLYSGDHGPQPYAIYRITRRDGGGYLLEDGRTDSFIAEGRTIDHVIAALPDAFYFTKYLT
jgi:hypothetical protein